MPINIGEMTTDVAVEEGASPAEGGGYSEDHSDHPASVPGAKQPPVRDNRRTAAENYDD